MLKRKVKYRIDAALPVWLVYFQEEMNDWGPVQLENIARQLDW